MSETPNPSLIVVPDSVRDAAKAKERAHQLERRHVALQLLASPAIFPSWGGLQPVNYAAEMVTAAGGAVTPASPLPSRVDSALREADELIAKTGGHNE